MVRAKEVAAHFKEDHLTRPLIKYFFYRPSIFLSWAAISLKIHAHFVNLLGLLIMLAAAAIFFFAGSNWAILAGALFLFGLVADLSDGTVARYYGKKNAMGKWLDESSGFIGFCAMFFVIMLKNFIETNNLWLIILGTYTIFSYMMINYAALLSEVLRKKFNLSNPLDEFRKKAGKKCLGISPGLFAFSLDIQWTLVALGVMLNAPYFLFIIFGVISSIQWMSRYIIFFGK